MSQKLDAKIELILLTIRHEKERLSNQEHAGIEGSMVHARVAVLEWVLRQIVEIDERVK